VRRVDWAERRVGCAVRLVERRVGFEARFAERPVLDDWEVVRGVDVQRATPPWPEHTSDLSRL
jgi:hypothetical protein